MGAGAAAYSWKQRDQGRQTTVRILETLLQLCCRSSAMASKHNLEAQASERVVQLMLSDFNTVFLPPPSPHSQKYIKYEISKNV